MCSDINKQSELKSKTNYLLRRRFYKKNCNFVKFFVYKQSQFGNGFWASEACSLSPCSWWPVSDLKYIQMALTFELQNQLSFCCKRPICIRNFDRHCITLLSSSGVREEMLLHDEHTEGLIQAKLTAYRHIASQNHRSWVIGNQKSASQRGHLRTVELAVDRTLICYISMAVCGNRLSSQLKWLFFHLARPS